MLQDLMRWVLIVFVWITIVIRYETFAKLIRTTPLFLIYVHFIVRYCIKSHSGFNFNMFIGEEGWIFTLLFSAERDLLFFFIIEGLLWYFIDINVVEVWTSCWYTLERWFFMWVLLFPWVGPVVTLLHGGVSRIVGKTPTQCDVKLLESWESIITYSLQSVYRILG